MSAGVRSRVVTGVRLGLVLVITATLLGSGPARAQDASASSLGGYSGVAQADGLHAFYNPSGVLPIAAPLDLGAPDAYATIGTGPATFARASAADPGDLVANPDALFATGVSGWKSGTIPAYPYRATASTGTQPFDESSPGPGLDARASADDTGSQGIATMPATTTPGLATFGTMSSTATTTTDGNTVTVHARTEISDLDVLGVLKVGSIITDVTATSDGSAVQLSGGTVVSGGAIAGVPVDIDAGGVRAAQGATTTTNVVSGILGGVLPPVLGSVNDILTSLGMHITVAGPVQTGNEKAGTFTSAGLSIDLELSEKTFPALKQVLDALPELPSIPGLPLGLGDAIALAEARHLVSIQVGRGAVALTATTAKPFTAAPAATRPATSGAASTTGSTGSSSTGSTSSAARPALTTATPTLASAAPALDDSAPASLGAGIGALVLLALLVQPFMGRWLARGTTTIIGGQSAAACPWEGR